MTTPRRSIHYQTASGRKPYADYLESLRDRLAVAKIRTRVTRAEMGNLGNHRSVGLGVIELKIDFGPGYRVYVGLHGSEWIVLLCAGDKSTQNEDIFKAHGYWQDYKENA